MIVDYQSKTSPVFLDRCLSGKVPIPLTSFLTVFIFFIVTTGADASPSCTLSMQDVIFGNVTVTTGLAVDTTATLQVTCSGTAPSATVCINIGAAAADDATSRQMAQPSSSTIRYDLYTSAARTTVWGSWKTGYKSPGVEAVVVDGTTNFTIYGRLFGSQQSAASGSYSSTFTANPYVEYKIQKTNVHCPLASPFTTSTSSFR